MCSIIECAVVLSDVAGTTTKLSFVQETLSKYIFDNVSTFLKDNWTSEGVVDSLKLVKEGEEELTIESAAELIIKLTKEKSTNEGLKTLQGLIYKSGYDGGTLKGHVFPDVFKCFENWSKNHKIAIYSTGSVESQQLLFKHSTEGDLSAHIIDYFDQSVGLKTEASSYVKIAEKLEVKPKEILFLSDDVKELKAAADAGLLKMLVKREGNEEIAEDVAKDFTVVTSFEDIKLETTNKRKNEDEIGVEEPPAKVLKIEESTSIVTVKSSDAKPENEEKENAKKEDPVVEAMEVDTTTSEVVPTEQTPEVEKVTETKSVVVEAMETDEAEAVVPTEEIKPVEDKTEVKDADKITEPISEKTVEKTNNKTAESIPETKIEKTVEQPKSEAECDTKVEKTQEEIVKTESKTESTVEKVSEPEKVIAQAEEPPKVADDAAKEIGKEIKVAEIIEEKESVEVKENLKDEKVQDTVDKVEECDKVAPVEDVQVTSTVETTEAVEVTEEKATVEVKVTENGDSTDAQVSKNGDSSVKVTEGIEIAVEATESIPEAEVAAKVESKPQVEVAKLEVEIAKELAPESKPEVEVAKEVLEETLVKTVTETVETEKSSNGTEENGAKKTDDVPEINGKHENGKCQEVPEVTTTNGESVEDEGKNGVEDIKIKKLEASEGSPAVTVEV